DCGGLSCPNYPNSKTDSPNTLDSSRVRTGGVCAAPAPTCVDGVKNGTETDVDCGGASCPKCANGKVCSANADCSSATCSGGVCDTGRASCSDRENGAEAGVACGGAGCGKCVS